jgi:ABC-2 type transport system ATP-binding protein
MLLTTQYLEEADVLADAILVIDHGLAIAQGTPDELKAQTGGQRIEVVLADPARSDEVARALGDVALGEVQVSDSGRDLSAGVPGGTPELEQVLHAVRNAGIEVLDIGLRRPTMDDVFLSLTGRSAEEAEDGEQEEVAS